MLKMEMIFKIDDLLIYQNIHISPMSAMIEKGKKQFKSFIHEIFLYR